MLVVHERVVVVRYHPPVDDEGYQAHLDEVAAALASIEGPVAGVVEINAPSSNHIRARSAAFWRAHKERLARDMVGLCFVPHAKAAKGLLVASKWLGLLPIDFDVRDSVADAVAFCQQRLPQP